MINFISNYMQSPENPLYPIEIDDYPKLFDYVLTADGLVFFQSLKRNYVLGKEMTQDEYNKLRLLYVYYATGNRNISEVFRWQELCVTLDNMGIPEKEMYQSKENLKDTNLITQNPYYVSGLYRKYTDYVKSKMNSK
jgi:hypothetical protein